MSVATSLFASHARGTTFTFRCAVDCQVGAYSLNEGEPLKAVKNPNGLWALYVDWGDGAIGSLAAHDVNKLAGYEVIEEPICTGTDPVRCDDPKCVVHGASSALHSATLAGTRQREVK